MHNIYILLINIIIIQRQMRWVGHVECMGKKSVQGFGAKAQKKEATWKTEA
jgi:hypothetical protein